MKKLRLVMVLPLMFAMMGGLMMIGCDRNREKFSYERIIVSMTEEASAAKAAHLFTPDDFFPDVVLSEVSVLTEPHTPVYRTMLLLTLKNPGRDNVLRAVDALNRRSDVHRASLNYFLSDL